MEKIFSIALAAGVLACLLLGRGDLVLSSATQGAQQAVTLCLGLVGGCALWGGLVSMADGAGLSRGLARLFKPLIGRLLPGIAHDTQAQQAVSAALAANMLGIGNASTPLALKAMSLLPDRQTADRFWLISAFGLQLLPTTVMAMRQAAGSANPADILPANLAVSALGLTLAVMYIVVFGRRKAQNKGVGP